MEGAFYHNPHALEEEFAACHHQRVVGMEGTDHSQAQFLFSYQSQDVHHTRLAEAGEAHNQPAQDIQHQDNNLDGRHSGEEDVEEEDPYNRVYTRQHHETNVEWGNPDSRVVETRVGRLSV